MPCEICFDQDECTCGGCRCKWCRHARGDDLSDIERDQINAHIRAHAKADQRKKAREREKAMNENFAALMAKNTKPI